MKNTNIVTTIFKGISLVLLDIITFIIVFLFWTLSDTHLFQWVLSAVVFALIFTNVMVSMSKKCVQLFGVAAYSSALVSTFLYYLFVMFFTGYNYLSISPKWYVISILIATLVYVAILAGLYIAGVNKNTDASKQQIEQAKVLDVNLQIMNINDAVLSCSDFVDPETYTAMKEAFFDMKERLMASTPFGRTIKPIVVNLENQIFAKLTEIQNNIMALKSTNPNNENCKSITDTFVEVKTLIINRERLIVQ